MADRVNGSTNEGPGDAGAGDRDAPPQRGDEGGPQRVQPGATAKGSGGRTGGRRGWGAVRGGLVVMLVVGGLMLGLLMVAAGASMAHAATQLFDFETGNQGWTVAGDPTTCLGIPSRSPTWSLGTSLPGEPGQALPSTWWTNPNLGLMGAERSHVTSPVLTASDSTVSINFDSYSSNENGYSSCGPDVEHVQISINGSPLIDVHGASSDLHNFFDRTFRNITFTTSTGIVPGDLIQYRFLYDTADDFDSPGANVTGWAFDNVLVTGASEAQGLTALSPAKVWVGLKNSDAVGLRVDLKAEVFLDDTKIGEGQLDNIASGSSGFNNARLNAIPLTLSASVDVPEDAVLEMTLSVRRTCVGSGHASGTVRLWYNGPAVDSGRDRDAGSHFEATIDGEELAFFLRSGLALSEEAGTSLLSQDVAVNSQAACPGRPYTAFGTWSLTLP